VFAWIGASDLDALEQPRLEEQLPRLGVDGHPADAPSVTNNRPTNAANALTKKRGIGGVMNIVPSRGGL
jgi:hypothetical protein